MVSIDKHTEGVGSLEVIESVEFSLDSGSAIEASEFEQALRDVLRTIQDNAPDEEFVDKMRMPVRIPDTALVGFPDKIQTDPVQADGLPSKVSHARDAHDSASNSGSTGSGSEFTLPPGLEDPMKICPRSIASSSEEDGDGDTQWHKQAPKHVQIANNTSPPSRKARFCTQCGEKVPPTLATAKFCTFCGAEHPSMPAEYQNHVPLTNRAVWEQSMRSQAEADAWHNFLGNAQPWWYDNFQAGYADSAMLQTNYQSYGPGSLQV